MASAWAVLFIGGYPILAIVKRIGIAADEAASAIRAIARHGGFARILLHLNLARAVFTSKLARRYALGCAALAGIEAVVVGQPAEFGAAVFAIRSVCAGVGRHIAR